tara:strand:+ start:71 stop:421 length:351 start_codon:yes stop_codon:yes gene_type:complete
MRYRAKILDRLTQIIESGPWQTRAEFCDSIGISAQVLSNLFHPESRREIPKSLMNGLIRLNYNMTWLYYGYGPMKNYSTEREEVLDLRSQITKLAKIKELLERQDDEKQILEKNGG